MMTPSIRVIPFDRTMLNKCNRMRYSGYFAFVNKQPAKHRTIGLHQKKLLDVAVADSFSKRLQGLLLHKSLPVDSGLMLDSCNAVHTIGMSFPIDVVFLDTQKKVVGVRNSLKPQRFAYCAGAESVIECSAGFAAANKVTKGQILVW